MNLLSNRLRFRRSVRPFYKIPIQPEFDHTISIYSLRCLHSDHNHNTIPHRRHCRNRTRTGFSIVGAVATEKRGKYCTCVGEPDFMRPSTSNVVVVIIIIIVCAIHTHTHTTRNMRCNMLQQFPNGDESSGVGVCLRLDPRHHRGMRFVVDDVWRRLSE